MLRERHCGGALWFYSQRPLKRELLRSPFYRLGTRLRDGKVLGSANTAGKWPSWNSDPGLFDPVICSARVRAAYRPLGKQQPLRPPPPAPWSTLGQALLYRWHSDPSICFRGRGRKGPAGSRCLSGGGPGNEQTLFAVQIHARAAPFCPLSRFTHTDTPPTGQSAELQDVKRTGDKPAFKDVLSRASSTFIQKIHIEHSLCAI